MVTLSQGRWLAHEISYDYSRADLRFDFPRARIGAYTADGTTVMKVIDGVVSRVPVRTGIRDAGFVEVTEGLLERDLIVLKAGAFVRDGDHVRPVQPAPVTN